MSKIGSYLFLSAIVVGLFILSSCEDGSTLDEDFESTETKDVEQLVDEIFDDAELDVQQESKALCGISSSSGYLELRPFQDGRAFSISPDSPAEHASYFASDAWTWSGRPGKVRSHVQFDLSVIPSNAYIVRAVLTLYHHPDIGHSSHTRSNASYLERVIRPWSAGTMDWNNQPAATTSNRVYLAQSTKSTQDYALDVKGMIEDMRRYGNYGMRIRLANESYYARMYFASSDYPNYAYHPKLEILYYTCS